MEKIDFIKPKYKNIITIISTLVLFVLTALFWGLYCGLKTDFLLSVASGLTASFVISMFFELTKLNDKLRKRGLFFGALFFSLKGFEEQLLVILKKLNGGKEYDFFGEATKTKDLIKESHVSDEKMTLFDLYCPAIYEVFLGFQENRLQLLFNGIISQDEFILFGKFDLLIAEHKEIETAVRKSPHNLNNDNGVNKSILGTYYILSEVRKIKSYSKYIRE